MSKNTKPRPAELHGAGLTFLFPESKVWIQSSKHLISKLYTDDLKLCWNMIYIPVKTKDAAQITDKKKE